MATEVQPPCQPPVPPRPARCRLVALGDSTETVVSRLRAFGKGQQPTGVYVGRRPAEGAPSVAFLFTGLGSEHPGMGRELFAASDVFRRELSRCDAIHRRLTGNPLLVSNDPPFGDCAPLASTSLAQPALFAFEYALAETWRAAGVEPSAVIGYSLGEDVAACVAGVASVEDLMAFVVARARHTEGLQEPGGMLAVFADESSVRRLIDGRPGLAIAAVNGPENTVVAGEAGAIQALADDLPIYRLRAKRVQTSHAFHSPLMNPILGDLEQTASSMLLRPPRIPMISSNSGRWVAGAEVLRPQFWSRRVRETVRFAEGLGRLQSSGYTLFLEIGPHPTLLSIASRCLSDGFHGIPALRRDENDVWVMTAAMAELFVHGLDVQPPSLNSDRFEPMRRRAFSREGCR